MLKLKTYWFHVHKRFFAGWSLLFLLSTCVTCIFGLAGSAFAQTTGLPSELNVWEQGHQAYTGIRHEAWLVVFVLYGCCVGSFLNVVVYRLPAGMSLVTPGSHCPICGHKLAWYDNIPVLGWLMLRGRCRYCGTAISIQYPLVELVTGLLTGWLYVAYYMPSGLPGTAMEVWTLGDTWPVFVVHLLMLAALIAATRIDALMYIIPLPIPWFVTLVALVGLPLASGWHPETLEMMPRASGPWLWAGVGSLVGLVLAIGLLWRGILPMSFAPSEEEIAKYEAEQIEKAEKAEQAKRKPSDSNAKGDNQQDQARPPMTKRDALMIALFAILIGVSLFAGGGWRGWGGVAAFALLFWGTLLHRYESEGEADSGEGQSDDNAEATQAGHDEIGSPEEWLAHPNPRGEIAKEIKFLLLPIIGAAIGYLAGGTLLSEVQLPAWGEVLGGVILGYLVGGGVIWGTRILGTLAFNKEAMGLGDVHLLGAIGAVLGALESVLIFFIAPFMGLLGAVILLGAGIFSKGGTRAIPYGPYLAAAAILMMFYRDPILSFFDTLVTPPGETGAMPFIQD